jgi:hypothetical protein
MVMRGQGYDRVQLRAVLETLLAELGSEKFSQMPLLQLERMVRQSPQVTPPLPGKTLLRQIINEFRFARWPDLPRKPAGRRFW